LQQLTIEIGKVNTTGLTLGESLCGLKVIMSMVGLCDYYMLPPLTTLSDDIVERIKQEAKPIVEKYC
jgi:hypothetical protein